MRELQDLIRDIQNAVILASDAAIKKNYEIIDTYFEAVDPRSDSADEGNSFLGNYTPKMVAFEYPIMKPKNQPGPDTHRVFVPLISLAPPATYYIEEVSVQLDIEMHVDEDGKENFILVAPRQSEQPEGTGPEEKIKKSHIEIIVKRGERPAGVTLVVDGYDRALRAEIPG